MSQTKPNTVLQIKKITKDFGYRRILKGVSFGLNQNEMTLLLGKNGAGKSTLMKIITGLLRPNSGEIIFAGETITKQPQKLRKAMGVISHSSQFYGDMTAYENLIFFSKLKKIKEIKKKVEEALNFTGLNKFSSVAVKTFSSGMNKRLSIAKLLVFKPKLLFLDEPYTGLDYDSIDFFNNFLTDFKDQGGTILMISHQIETCFNFSDKIAIMENGVTRTHQKTESFSLNDLLKEYQGPTNN